MKKTFPSAATLYSALLLLSAFIPGGWTFILLFWIPFALITSLHALIAYRTDWSKSTNWFARLFIGGIVSVPLSILLGTLLGDIVLQISIENKIYNDSSMWITHAVVTLLIVGMGILLGRKALPSVANISDRAYLKRKVLSFYSYAMFLVVVGGGLYALTLFSALSRFGS